MEEFKGILSIWVEYYLAMVLGGYVGFFHWNYTTFWETYLEISLQYWAMTFLKDFTSLKFLHPWMHKPENYWIHKNHHKVHHELNVLHTYRIDRIDVFLENAIGPVLLVIFQYLLLGKTSVHLLAFFFLNHHDAVIHSVNPYTVVHFNPIIDFYFKPNIEHNLHHITQEDYYMFNSWRHFDRKLLEADVAKYNELLGTNVSFDLFIVDNDKKSNK